MTTCSDGSAEVGEQLEGSAPEAAAWVALEQSGPWGAKAFSSSHLDPDLGRAIEAAAAAHRTRPVLVRRPGRHADRHLPHGDDHRWLLAASTHPDGSWLLAGRIAVPEDVLSLDWAALEAGDAEAVRRSLPTLGPTTGPHLLVCTNGTRDVCCATKGRPLALAMTSAFPGRVWEVTHTSGHRFAPTAVLLPAGTLHGRLDVPAATALVRAAESGRTVLPGSRGRSTWAGPAQVAELAVREATGEDGLAALVVESHEQTGEHRWRAAVRHRDGRRWTVEVRSQSTDVTRAESCGKAGLGMRRYTTAIG
jgi:hypothetical protein